MDFSLHDVLGAAEHIIKTDTRRRPGDIWTLEDEIALIVLSLEASTHSARAKRVDTSGAFARNHAASAANADAPGVVIVGLFILLVFLSITLVNWYFRATFGV